MSILGEWDSFYMIVASAAAALVGLQFVSLTLLAERPPPGGADAGAAFSTPTIVHFSAVLFLSALVRAPWRTMTPIAIIWGVASIAGVTYSIIVVRRMRRQTAYEPAFEDWFFHAILPLATYALLGVSALVSCTHPRAALFGIGAAILLLLFIGIHNVWDAIVYQVFFLKR
jgi:hypothetical protein